MTNSLLSRFAPVCGVLVALTSAAHAQAPGINPEDAVTPMSVVEGRGVKVGEGTVIHTTVGIEAGVVSNVFFEDQNATAAGLLRILAEFGTGSLPRQRLSRIEKDEANLSMEDSGSFQYRADARLSYDYYPSTNNNVSSQGGLGAGFLFRGIVNPGKPVQFAVVENFGREIRATNFESPESTNRDINDLKLQVQWAPSGRNLSGTLHYENRIDVFERNNQRFANRFQNTIGLRINYQWLPQTRFYGDVSQGVYTGLGSDSTKVTSYPLTAVLGIQTLITPKITFVSRAGYTNGFYASGPSFSSFVFGAQVGYRYTELGRITALYNFIHEDSINANFYRDHQFGVNLEHGFAPFLLLASGELRFRHYEGVIVSGPTTRDDTLGSLRGEVRYNFRDWLATSVSYQFSVVSTDYMYDAGGGVILNPSFQRHELLLGVRAAY